MAKLEGNVHFNGPLTNAEADPPAMAVVEVLETVNRLVVVVVRFPLVSVSVPDTVVAPVNVTPVLLLMVRLLAPVNPLPVTCADVPS